MRILVTGGREVTNKEAVWSVLSDLKPTMILHGKCLRGADLFAARYAEKHGIPNIEVPANWDYYGKSAGPVRNRWMLDYVTVDKVVAFPTKNSVGTRDMIEYAKEKGFKPLVYEL